MLLGAGIIGIAFYGVSVVRPASDATLAEGSQNSGGDFFEIDTKTSEGVGIGLPEEAKGTGWEEVLANLPRAGEDWRQVGFDHEVWECVYSETGICQTRVELRIPPRWDLRQVNYRAGAGMGGEDCWDYRVVDEGDLGILLVQPLCEASTSTYQSSEESLVVVNFMPMSTIDNADVALVRFVYEGENRYGDVVVENMLDYDVDEILHMEVFPSVFVRYDTNRVSILSADILLLDEQHKDTADAIIASMRAVDR